MTQKPLVSVVIPTVGRPSLREAALSAKCQNVNTEIIIVLDQPHNRDIVLEILKDIPHILLMTPGASGGAVARNLGLWAATGTHIAYLDDDDLWDSRKLLLQLHALETAPRPSQSVCVSATKFVRAAKGRDSIKVIPKNTFNPEHETIADYLVARKDLRYGRNFMQTSSILGPTHLMRAFAWNESLRKHQDWDLFSRLLSQHTDIDVLQLEKPLVTVHQRTEGSVSHRADWHASSVWYGLHSGELSRRGRADFLWSQILRASLRQRSVAGLLFWARRIGAGVPHVAAAITGLSGALRR